MAELLNINPDGGDPVRCPSCESTSFYRFEAFSGVDIITLHTGDGLVSSRDGQKYNAEWDGPWFCENDHDVSIDDDTADLLDELFETTPAL